MFYRKKQKEKMESIYLNASDVILTLKTRHHRLHHIHGKQRFLSSQLNICSDTRYQIST